MDHVQTAKKRRLRRPRLHPQREVETPFSGSRHRVVSNFAVLGLAEIACRAMSMVVTLTLAHRLGASGFGRIEFAFNVVFWLVLVVRDCLETIVTREIARHPRIIRTLVGRVVAVKVALATPLLLLLGTLGWLLLREPTDALVLALYGLLLISTAFGIDFVYRGTERMGLVAASLFLRTLVYSLGVLWTVSDRSHVLLVPLWLAAGEGVGITLVWLAFARRYGVVRPVFRRRFIKVFLSRGHSVVVIQLSQAVLISADLMIVGMTQPWSEVGRYSAPHRLIAALLAFSLIYQQVVFPTLARSWRLSAESGRRLLNRTVAALVIGVVPVTVGGSLLSESIVRAVLPPDYRDSAWLLTIGLWRVPLMSLAFFYQSALIAVNRESAGLRLLFGGAIAAVPCVFFFLSMLGLVGASFSVVLMAGVLAIAGYLCLVREGRAPAVHHHLLRPAVAAGSMIPVCLSLERYHVTLAVMGGAVTYGAVLLLLGTPRDLGFLTAASPAPFEG